MSHEVDRTGQLHHVEVYVSELRQSREFWGWLLEHLGYQEYQSWNDGFSYRLGPTYLVFVQTAKRFLAPGYHRCRSGLNHLAFHARSRREIDELVGLLENRGIRILYRDRHPFAGGDGYYAVFFEDPDRIKVEVVAPS